LLIGLKPLKGRGGGGGEPTGVRTDGRGGGGGIMILEELQ